MSLTDKIKHFDYQDFFKSILWALIIALIFRTFIFEPFRIPSGSMLPTLKVGDYLFVSKYSYGYSMYSLPTSFNMFEGRLFNKVPTRGDIIVFKGVKDPSTYYIKRVMGLPGDKIQVIGGTLYVNGKAVSRIFDGKYTEKGRDGREAIFNVYKETLVDTISYKTLEPLAVTNGGAPETTKVYNVPEKHYFMIGDNRGASADSRYAEMGFIPEENLVGKAVFLLWTHDLLKDYKNSRALSYIG